MTLELDHFFIITGPGAPEADLLSAVGLTEGPANDHPGQGTANRRFFFPNTGLELIYLRDENEARHGPGRRLRIADRASESNASPFGLIVRPGTDSPTLPFPGWRYCPEYFAPDQCFHVGENSDVLEEPLCVYLPPNLPKLDPSARSANAHLRLTGLRLSVPVATPSATLEAVSACDQVTLQLNAAHRLELAFNDAAKGQMSDFSPSLPLSIRW